MSLVSGELKMWFYHIIMCSKEADRMAKSVDPDQPCLPEIAIYLWLLAVCKYWCIISSTSLITPDSMYMSTKIWGKKITIIIWTASSEFGNYRICEQWRFRRACASAQSRQNLRCALIQAVSQEEPSDRKPDPWPFWMAGHVQLKFVMTECSKTQIRLTGLI